MRFESLDITAALRRLADRRIEEAMREGKFDNLPGAGAALELEPMPADEDARVAWWALRILRRNDCVPEEVRWRKMLDVLRIRVQRVRDEARLVRLVEQYNGLVHRINTLGTNALQAPAVPLDFESERRRLLGRCAAEG